MSKRTINRTAWTLAIAGSVMLATRAFPQESSKTATESKPNIVLVHGAFADGSSWSKVVGLLQKKGYNVTAAQIPLTSLEDDVAVTRRVLDAQKGPTVLVGHSYAGLVISEAASGASNVSGLVYIAAFGLDEGESIDALSKQGPAPPGSAAIHPDPQGYLWLDRSAYPKVFAGDVNPAEASVMAAVQKPWAYKALTTKAGPPAWKNKPSWYLVSTNDQMIPPDAQRVMSKRMGATIRTVPSSHAVMVSHPKEVVDIITLAAASKGTK
jgi:pimeloyl-ACP methyl ester carboxylesterase